MFGLGWRNSAAAISLDNKLCFGLSTYTNSLVADRLTHTLADFARPHSHPIGPPPRQNDPSLNASASCVLPSLTSLQSHIALGPSQQAEPTEEVKGTQVPLSRRSSTTKQHKAYSSTRQHCYVEETIVEATQKQHCAKLIKDKGQRKHTYPKAILQHAIASCKDNT